MEIKAYETLHDDAKYIRIKVFVEEQGFNEEFDTTDNICTHIVLYDENKPVATVRFYKENNDYYIGRLAVLKEYRGLHLGAKAVKEAERLIAQKGGKTVILHSQWQAKEFYEKQGYTQFGECDYDESCLHCWMKKSL